MITTEHVDRELSLEELDQLIDLAARPGRGPLPAPSDQLPKAG